MSTVTLRWIGDLDQDKREQAGCVSSSSDQYRPQKIELKPGQHEIRIGRMNTKKPPDYPIESCINSRMISRNHATIERSAKGGSILYDHSMNGTYVNYTRVMGGVTLKHGDIVCFGHLNGANLKPGEQVSLFYSDLKYRVELSDFPSTKEVVTGTTGKKRKTHPPQPGSTVSSTQRSDGEDDASEDSDEDTTDSKRPRLSGASSARSANRQKFKKPNTGSTKTKLEDDDDDEIDSADDAFENSANKRSKLSKKKSNGTEKLKKAAAANSFSRKSSSAKIGHSYNKEKRNRSSKTGKLEDDAAGSDIFHYDSEECSARPCKQPQDIAIDWIQCDRCTLWYHQVCVGLKPSEANVETYYCPYCKK